MNTRGESWKRLMNLYDAEAIKKAQKIVKVQPKANIKLPKSPTIGKPIKKVKVPVTK
jgi:hypothetical protein